MFGWLKELYDIGYMNRSRKVQLDSDTEVCRSCETLKMQLAIANEEKKLLLERLLNPPVVETPQADTKEMKPIQARHIPFETRRHMLEAEDRAQARILKQREMEAKTAQVDKAVEKLEEEIGVKL